MYWANFLHIYQPPIQKDIWVRRVTDECYRKLFAGLLKIPRARLSLNINSVLCELLEKNGGTDVIKNIKELVDRGSIELTGSAKYHAFLPYLPESEIRRQILLNEEGLNKYFGTDWKKGGFFSPEMAYSEKIAKVARELGYKWIVIDEMAFPANHKEERNKIYDIEGLDKFSVFFRERNLSFKILSASQVSSLPNIIKFLSDRIGKDEYTVTAMDGETFGHHRPGLENLLFDLLRQPEIKPVTISELQQIFSEHKQIKAREATWATVPKDFILGGPFARWNNPENEIHQYQWQLTSLALKIVKRNEKDPVRIRLDAALASDQYWWASAKPWWSLEWIEHGAFDLMNIILDAKKSRWSEKKLAKKLYQQIIYTGFEWQRTGIVDELSKHENEEVLEHMEEKEQMFMTAQEYQDMIKVLEEQMFEAAKLQEYHRANMIKERVRELFEEMKDPTKVRKETFRGGAPE